MEKENDLDIEAAEILENIARKLRRGTSKIAHTGLIDIIRNMNAVENFMTVDEACRFLGVYRQKFYDLIEKHEITRHPKGYRESDLIKIKTIIK